VTPRAKVVSILVIRSLQVSGEISTPIILADYFISTNLGRVEETIVRD